eukprot:TRINITY_DN14902_c0_g1_i6.p5 TRINITY_DN14902_c0_g1~~TRINITY_DN14902_c0_g1_i6.p5  ORF type:complete len:149 (-),score=1.81 TRINITY_DN14902_c0_g1_i6:309-755(-)
MQQIYTNQLDISYQAEFFLISMHFFLAVICIQLLVGDLKSSRWPTRGGGYLRMWNCSSSRGVNTLESGEKKRGDGFLVVCLKISEGFIYLLCNEINIIRQITSVFLNFSLDHSSYIACKNNIKALLKICILNFQPSAVVINIQTKIMV